MHRGRNVGVWRTLRWTELNIHAVEGKIGKRGKYQYTNRHLAFEEKKNSFAPKFSLFCVCCVSGTEERKQTELHTHFSLLVLSPLCVLLFLAVTLCNWWGGGAKRRRPGSWGSQNLKISSSLLNGFLFFFLFCFVCALLILGSKFQVEIPSSRGSEWGKAK